MKDSLCADLVSNSDEGQLALWGQLVDTLADSLLEVKNSFSVEDEDCIEAANGMQQVAIYMAFSPTQDRADGFVDFQSAVADAPSGGAPGSSAPSGSGASSGSAPFTFGDMLADSEGFARAVEEAVEANVRAVGEQEEEHYQRAAELFRTLPGLVDQPLRVVAEIQLHLSYYYVARSKSELPFRIKRSTTLRALASDCSAYKDKIVQ